jgi:hypothetical protein
MLLQGKYWKHLTKASDIKGTGSRSTFTFSAREAAINLYQHQHQQVFPTRLLVDRISRWDISKLIANIVASFHNTACKSDNKAK